MIQKYNYNNTIICKNKYYIYASLVIKQRIKERKMGKIKLTDNAITASMKMADGNMGATQVIMSIIVEGSKIDPDNALGGMGVLLSLDDMEIYGSDIYVLHNDICERDLVKTVAVLRARQLGFISESTIKDASSRQDRSGKSMIDVDDLYKKVKEYLPNFNPQPIED